MEGPSINTGHRCAICGRTSGPIEMHHIVFRSQGGKSGPTVTLCGFGNNLRDGDGKCWCHGLAHAYRLHFWWDGGEWSYLITDKPMKLEKALGLDGWKPIKHGGGELLDMSDAAPWLHATRVNPAHYSWDMGEIPI